MSIAIKLDAASRRKMVYLIGFLGCLLCWDLWAVTVAALQAPVQALKAEIFGGWMMVVKIAAAAMGILLSAFKGSLAPLGVGAGLSMGIHLYSEYLGDGAAGALI